MRVHALVRKLGLPEPGFLDGAEAVYFVCLRLLFLLLPLPPYSYSTVKHVIFTGT